MCQQVAEHRVFERVEFDVALPDGAGALYVPLREGVRNSMKIFLNELSDLEDSQEGLRALVEKRAPKWKNR